MLFYASDSYVKAGKPVSPVQGYWNTGRWIANKMMHGAMIGWYGNLPKLISPYNPWDGNRHERKRYRGKGWMTSFCASVIPNGSCWSQYFSFLCRSLSSLSWCNSSFLARKGRRKTEGRRREGAEEVGRGEWPSFHVTRHYSLRNGKLTKWAKYKYYWFKHLQCIAHLCHGSVCSFPIWALSFQIFSSLSHAVFLILFQIITVEMKLSCSNGCSYMCAKLILESQKDIK